MNVTQNHGQLKFVKSNILELLKYQPIENGSKILFGISPGCNSTVWFSTIIKIYKRKVCETYFEETWHNWHLNRVGMLPSRHLYKKTLYKGRGKLRFWFTGSTSFHFLSSMKEIRLSFSRDPRYCLNSPSFTLQAKFDLKIFFREINFLFSHW